MSDQHTSTRTNPRMRGLVERPAKQRWVIHLIGAPDGAPMAEAVALGVGTTILGRRPGAGQTMRLPDGAVSARHVALIAYPADTALRVQDLDSRNGTWLGGRRVSVGRADSGAVLRVGDHCCVLESWDELSGRAPPATALIPGDSHAARVTRHQVALAAADALPVLLQGETGTGKEYVAQAIHDATNRGGRLVRVNTAAIPASLFESELFGHAKGAFSGATGRRKGLFREADGGTLVLDEIGELSLGLQAKLLRVIEERRLRPVGGSVSATLDVKVVASTNLDIDKAIAEGRFRQDLAARLRLHQVQLAPLRERRADLLALCDTIAPSTRPPIPRASSSAAEQQGWAARFTADAIEALLLYNWPANLRELRALLIAQNAAHDAGYIDVPALPQPVREAVALRATTEGPGAAHVLSTAPSAAELKALLHRHQGSVTAVAAHAGVHRKQVYRWLKTTGLDPGAFRAPA